MKPKILLIDNYDSFTYNLYDYFLQLNTDCEVIRNDVLSFEQFCEKEFDGLVFSPGPKSPKDAGNMMQLIAHFYSQKPILGICLGHQGIGEYFGAKLVKAFSPMHGKTSHIFHKGHSIFKDLPPMFEVMRYHSLILEDLDEVPMYITAQTEDGEVMGLAHKKYPIYGVQFHPESILTAHGLAMLNNWLDIVKSGGLVIRKMELLEAKQACDLLKLVFDTDLSEGTSREGEHYFKSVVASPKGMLERRKAGALMFLAFKDGALAGMVEVRAPGHCTICFVHPDFQNRNYGAVLLKHALDVSKKRYPQSDGMTLYSAPKALTFYARNGFVKTGELEVKNGIPFVPMVYKF